jgi:hypothetical protein
MKPRRNNLKKVLNEHSRWVFSHGKAGKLADVKKWNLDKFNLENEDFPFAKLQFVSNELPRSRAARYHLYAMSSNNLSCPRYICL